MSEEISKAKKLRVLRNDVTVMKEAATFHERAQAEIGSEMGRFKSLNKQTVVGASGGPSYPAQPETSFWRSDDTGQEPALGFSINELEPVGTRQEVERSLDRAGTPPTVPVEKLPSAADPGSVPGPLKRRA